MVGRRASGTSSDKQIPKQNDMVCPCCAKEPVLEEPERRRLIRSLLQKANEDAEFKDALRHMVRDRTRTDAAFARAIRAAKNNKREGEDDEDKAARSDRKTIATLLALLDEYVAFMRVRWLEARRPAAERLPLGPSMAVDAVWHAHILDSRAYEVFCQRHFGSFEHHDPGMDEGQFQNTVRRLRETGTPHFADWWDELEVNTIVWDVGGPDDNILHAFTTDFMLGVGCG